MNALMPSPIRQAPLYAVKVLALSRNSGGTAGRMRLVLILGRAFFIAFAMPTSQQSNRQKGSI